MLLAFGRLSYPSQHACSVQSSSLQLAQPVLQASRICRSAQSALIKAIDIRRVVLLRMQRLKFHGLADHLSKLRSAASAAEEIGPVVQPVRFRLAPKTCKIVLPHNRDELEPWCWWPVQRLNCLDVRLIWSRIVGWTFARIHYRVWVAKIVSETERMAKFVLERLLNTGQIA